ncbi:MAG TPA: hypothetical protein VJ912_01585 [Candidatus Nanoarchaeia archaeon]|nr:hypothetical protein [Candidatus Nanoarchaeia archaeon]
MKNKKINLIIASILIIGIVASFGIVSADRELSNAKGIQIEDFVAGSTVEANFSYDYFEGLEENTEDSPLIFKLDVNSEEKDYPVWRGDFNINGYIERHRIFGLFLYKVPFSCKELNRTINHSLGSETVSGGNGTFYCYNRSADLKLDRHDNVFLDIKSEPALYPGNYSLSAKMFYLNDTYAPEVEILNKENFERVYYKSGNNIEVKTSISDVNLNKEETIGKIFWNESEIKLAKNYQNGTYYFSETLPDEIPEGNHTIEIFAKDIFGNSATDKTRLLIDETAPEIELISPFSDDVYSEIMLINASVIDEKAGVNPDSVRYRLREMNGTNICSGTGFGAWDCYNSGWKELNEMKEGSEFFTKEVNTTKLNLTSGEYWLDIKAKDILGNEAYLKND